MFVNSLLTIPGKNVVPYIGKKDNQINTGLKWNKVIIIVLLFCLLS